MDITAPSPSSPRVPLSEWFNARIVVFAAVMLVLIGFPIYVYVDAVVSGGVKDLGNGYTYVDLKTMSSFAFDQERGTVDDVPKRWRDLNGKKVVLQGEMYAATGAGSSVEAFDLVYSIQSCCLSGPPQIQHFIRSRAVDGAGLAYYSSQVRVAGTLRVNVTKDPETGKVNGVYYFDVEKVEPV